MRRSTILALALAGAPVGVVAQPALQVGAGLTSPLSDFRKVADPGYHLSLGVQVGLPDLPVGLRLDGTYHRLPEPSAAFAPPRVLGGALSVVFSLPGEGVEPYALFGVGRYRVEAGPVAIAEPVFDRGYQVGFGVSLGALAFGAFAEIRYVRVDGADATYLPLTVGLRM